MTAGETLAEEQALTCPGCGRTSSAPIRWSTHRPELPYEPAFGLALKLQTPCCGHTLWAYNPRHLDFLEAFVGATLRERTPNRNATVASRLPRWLKSAKHRDEVLRCLGRLKARASD